MSWQQTKSQYGVIFPCASSPSPGFRVQVLGSSDTNCITSDTNCIITSPPVSEKWWSVPYEIHVLFFLQSGLKVNSASWQMAAAHEDFDATRGISSHCIFTRHIHIHIHNLLTRPNLEAVLLVAMVLWTIRQFHWLSHFDHMLQIEDLWRSLRITDKTTEKIKDKSFP